jgi:hypothetical protein
MLDYGRILTDSASLCWQQRRAIWPLLLLFSLSGIGTGLLNFWLALDTRLAMLTDSEAVLRWLLTTESLPVEGIGPWIMAVLMLAFLYWLVITFAEGGLVGAVVSVQQGGIDQPGAGLDKTAVFRWGRRLLLRFLAIDALIFVPPFLLMLLALLLPLSSLLAAVWLEPRIDTVELLALPLLLGTVCGCLLLCLALPLLPLTLLWRTLALRETAVGVFAEKETTPTIRAAIKQSLYVARAHPAEILILALLLWGAVLTVHFLLSAVTWPFFTLLSTLPTGLRTPLGLLLAVLRAVPQAIVQTYFIVAWTLGYTTLVASNGWQVAGGK